MTETGQTSTTQTSWFKNWFDVAEPAPRFRLIALIEAITWALLLIGMGFKYGADIDSATMVPGMLHGIAFIAYVAITVWTAVELRWNWKVTALALFSAIPPFFSLLFEWWAQRNGHLDQPATSPVGDTPDDDHERMRV